MPEFSFVTLYLILGAGCALAQWADDFNHGRPLPGWGEYLMIVTLGPVAAVADLFISIGERISAWRQQK
jgi:hypothetical protein